MWLLVLGVAGAVLLLALLGPHRRLAPLYSDAHLAELLGLLPALADEARARRVLTRAEDLASRVTSGPMALGYSVAALGEGEEHHLSISTPRTAARAWGTLFLALIAWALGLPEEPTACFVSQNHVFHAVYVVPPGSVSKPAARRETPKEALRTAHARQRAVRARLTETAVPQA